MASLKNGLLTLLAGSTVFLIQTNPQQKVDYIADASRRASGLLCECSQGDFESICETLSPLIDVSIKGAFHVYTEKPKNFGLFSLFVTQFPGLEIYSVGIGGQFFYAVKADEKWMASSAITDIRIDGCLTAAVFLK
ncbi:MAG: hypothetical protein ACFB5Z_17025 [Elainellaceae cyanobacterium]